MIPPQRFYFLIVILVLGIFRVPTVAADEIAADEIAADEIAAPTTLSVQVNQAVVRQAPQQWAPKVLTLGYGTEVSVVSRGEGWIKIKSPEGVIGFLYEGALTTKRVIISERTDLHAIKADASEIVLAGKGFSKDIENRCATIDKELNYAAVDAIESRVFEDTAIVSFLHEGGIGGLEK